MCISDVFKKLAPEPKIDDISAFLSRFFTPYQHFILWHFSRPNSNLKVRHVTVIWKTYAVIAFSVAKNPLSSSLNIQFSSKSNQRLVMFFVVDIQLRYKCALLIFNVTPNFNAQSKAVQLLCGLNIKKSATEGRIFYNTLTLQCRV